MLNFLKNNSKKVINVNDIDTLLGKIDLIDIREPYEYNSGTLKTAKNIPMGTILNNPEKYLSKDKEYYIMCHSGARSSRTCSSLIKEGYNVVNVSGGMGSYVGTKRN
ncbi:rhodanese-like domain-containing protein [Clostridium grantii]|uniref:Rhodanese-related sulfurtransferase n=1 Tax=Clostridium grantii DSM 8605 TaxID=1121316 RepID=A0A1M5W158_9CLOT|nr:rhodanese-like domain-containing protein [Clostridium grantii]SHH81201.1 Rhodanese-related sulfurtransferase [Clostridium grantii DSM 8605]